MVVLFYFDITLYSCRILLSDLRWKILFMNIGYPIQFIIYGIYQASYLVTKIAIPKLFLEFGMISIQRIILLLGEQDVGYHSDYSLHSYFFSILSKKISFIFLRMQCFVLVPSVCKQKIDNICLMRNHLWNCIPCVTQLVTPSSLYV